MKVMLLGILMIALCACAITARYEKIMNSWIGADELNLVRSWGPPLGGRPGDSVHK